MRKDSEKWENLRNFWNNRPLAEKTQLASEKADVLLKGIVKRFFNEKEVTSTLVMDALRRQIVQKAKKICLTSKAK